MPRRKANLQNRELLTRREAAAYLGVAEQTLAVWACAKRNNLPVIKVGLVEVPPQGFGLLLELEYSERWSVH
jgi:hypothetical protein